MQTDTTLLMQQINMKQQPNSNFNKYLKYSGIAFQMVAVILGGVYLGKFLDQKFPNESAIYSVICIMIAVCLSILLAIKDFIFKRKE